MKKYLTLFSILLLVQLSSTAQDASLPDSTHSAVGKMKSYFFVLLKAGPVRTQDSITVQRIQEGHMANINHMASLGKLVVAGPFLDDGEWRGIYIFDVQAAEEVEKLLQGDPAISSRRLIYEIHPWMTMTGTCFK